jgi:hypothetical protein
MSKVAAALLVTLSINMFLFLANIAIVDINPGVHYFNVEGTPLGSKLDSSTYSFNSSNVSGDLPTFSSSVSAETGLSLVDIPLSAFSWLTDKVSLLWQIVTAVPDFLEGMALPGALTGALSALWYIYNLVLIVMFIFGDRS